MHNMERLDYEYFHDIDGPMWMRQSHAYRSLGPFRIVTTLMVAVGIALIVFGLVCAVAFVSDIAEEHPSRARWTLRALITFNLIVHTCILLVDQLSWWRSLISLSVNVLYLRLLRTFPYVPNLNAPFFLVIVLAVLLESAMWYWYTIQLMYYTSALLIAGFFLMLWLVPVGFLVSCDVEDDRLPGGSNGGLGAIYNRGPGAGAGHGFDAFERGGDKRRTRSIFSRLMQAFRGA